jgi:hypothetical protein
MYADYDHAHDPYPGQNRNQRFDHLKRLLEDSYHGGKRCRIRGKRRRRWFNSPEFQELNVLVEIGRKYEKIKSGSKSTPRGTSDLIGGVYEK